jgi:hypothetical protein
LTLEQDRQREVIVEQPFAAEDAAVILAQLGFRVQNVILAEDDADAQLQQRSIFVNDYYTLYDSDDSDGSGDIGPL